MEPQTNNKPWELLAELLDADQPNELLEFIDSLTAAETTLAVSRLTDTERGRLLSVLHPEDAAELIETIPDSQAADIIEELVPEKAASILEELDSDHVVDLLGEMDEDEANAILAEMSPEDAEEARQFLQYPADSAGGLMISEFLAFRREQTVRDVLDDLQRYREDYEHYDVQYLYVTDEREHLVGVLRIRDLLFPKSGTRLETLMIANPHRVKVDTPLDELRSFFDEYDLFGVPVVDADSGLLGVLLPAAVAEAAKKRSVRQFLGFSGIVGGEEFRSMPLFQRSGRRLSWLSLNILLNIFAASVIALYQDTLSAVIALAVFLPMVSDMSGCSGNQAVAVSIRELSLGLVRPNEFGVCW